ncbi:hypothetical protein C8R44DRAFT_742897 [Mycena epipterygia]|nr:hypothetical protein C8R44DRAFT_742897 [Mycena epipterygia]
MLNSKSIPAITVLLLLSMASRASAQDLNITVEVCTGALDPPTGCVTIPALSDDCINLIGGFTFLNKEISSAEVPRGIFCTFFQSGFGCASADPNDGKVVLREGVWDFSNIPGKDDTVDFNDLTGSFSCYHVKRAYWDAGNEDEGGRDGN